MRALYRCQSVSQYKDHKLVQLFAASDGSPHSNELNIGKPSGLVELTVTSERGQEFFKAGDDYYVDFSRKGFK